MKVFFVARGQHKIRPDIKSSTVIPRIPSASRTEYLTEFFTNTTNLSFDGKCSIYG
jgi:hypothetical protein